MRNLTSGGAEADCQRSKPNNQTEELDPSNKTHADCVGSVASETGQDDSASLSADTGQTLRNFDSDESVPAQPSKPKVAKASKPKQELVDALAKADPAVVQDLFDSWAETGKGKSHPSDERLGLIARALVDWSFPVEDVRDALTGWVSDPWEERERFKDVRYLLGSVEKVETFRDLKRNPQKKSRNNGSGLRGDFSDVKRYEEFDVSTAFGRKPAVEVKVNQ